MNKVLMILTVIMLIAGAAYADHFNVVKKAGDVIASLTMENHSLTVNNNDISIELLDLEGKAITNAEMAVYYFMPSMPAMNYEVKALPKGEHYTAMIKPTMPGVWIADISAKIGEKEQHIISFSFDAE
jgi:nitrogen fixation protein FixH